MTTQLPAPPSAGYSVPTAAAIFPPSFPELVKKELRRTLARDYPAVILDVDNTWLNLYELKSANIPPFTEFPVLAPTPMPRTIRKLTRAMPMLDSLIDHFLGKLTLDEGGDYGLFVSPTTVVEAEQIEGLTQVDVQYIYLRLTRTLADAYTERLTSHWTTAVANGKTRQQMFIEEHVQALQMEAQVGVEQGSLTAVEGSMVEAMLRYSQDQSLDPVQQHGVYSLSLVQIGQPTIDFVGCFVLSYVCNNGLPLVDDAKLGPVLLYTPNAGLEGFASFPLLTESLTQRLADPAQKEQLFKNIECQHAASYALAHQQDATRYAWKYVPIGGNFLSQQLFKQKKKQLSDFIYSVDIAKTRALDCQGFLELLSQTLDPRDQFDNFLNLDRNDRNIIDASMPDWWRAMSTGERNEWLDSAETFGSSIIELQRSTQDQLNKPELSSERFLQKHIDNILTSTLAEKKIQLTPDEIFVDIFYFAALHASQLASGLISSRPTNDLTKRYTLRSLAIEGPDLDKPGYVRDTFVRDKNNARINELDAGAVDDLLVRIDVEKSFDDFLAERLKTSAYARTLQEKATRLTFAQMRMGLLVARRQGFEQVGLDWIAAVLSTPDLTRREVKLKNIQLKFLKINNVPLSNIMLIAPSDAGEHRPVVLCTLNAPDGVTFRWFDSIEKLKQGFTAHPVLREYLMLQMPVAQRRSAKRSLAFDDWFKHYRLPTFFRHLPKPLPTPALLWEVVTFHEQRKNFFAENHDIRIEQMIADAKSYRDYSRNIQSSDHSTEIHLAVGIAILFLPAPVMIPLELGLVLYSTWEGVRKIDDNDYEGAAREFLVALGYLISAGIGTRSLTTKILPAISTLRRAPPLVRRIGPDGKEHIGFLLSPSIAPQLADPEWVTAFDPEKFSTVEIDDEVFYVRNRFNLFGHSRLYRQLPDKPGLLRDSGEFGLRDGQGVWSKALYQARGTSARVFRSAHRELERLTTHWPNAVESLSAVEKAQFETDYLHLASTSNSEFLPDILTYCEAGSGDINDLLRAGIKNTTTRKFLRDLYKLNAYQGMAYRAAHVSFASLQRLKGKPGLIYADRGVQSASVSRFNATRWSQDQFVTQHATANNQLVFMIFDESIPKRNMFSNLLGDHVGITPSTPMQLTAFKEQDGKLFAYFGTPREIDTERYDIYTGERQIIV